MNKSSNPQFTANYYQYRMASDQTGTQPLEQITSAFSTNLYYNYSSNANQQGSVEQIALPDNLESTPQLVNSSIQLVASSIDPMYSHMDATNVVNDQTNNQLKSNSSKIQFEGKCTQISLFISLSEIKEITKKNFKRLNHIF